MFRLFPSSTTHSPTSLSSSIQDTSQGHSTKSKEIDLDFAICEDAQPSEELRLENSESDEEKNTRGDLIIPDNAWIKQCPNPRGKTLTWPHRDIQFRVVNEDIFKKSPSSNDIVQGHIGECFLLGGLYSIFADEKAGEAIIRSMFKDSGEQVIVRLFDDYRVPHYLSIEKSIPSNGELSSGTLWLDILKKAYLGFFDADYNKLDGGHPDKALAVLTGASYSGKCSLPFQSGSRLTNMKDFVDGNGIYALHELMRISGRTPQGILQRLCHLIFNKNIPQIQLWAKWLHEGNKAALWRTIIEKNHPLQLCHVQEFFASFSLKNLTSETIEVITLVQNWITNEKILSGPKLSGQYSYEELHLFEEIKIHLKEQCPILLSSFTENQTPKGISPIHSHAVVGFEDNPETKHKYVLLRNSAPAINKLDALYLKLFGGIERIAVDKYNKKTGQWEVEIRTNGAINKPMRLELSDFCSAFERLVSMDSISLEAINARVDRAIATHAIATHPPVESSENSPDF